MKTPAEKTCTPLKQIYGVKVMDERCETGTRRLFNKIASTLSKRRRTVLPKLPKTVIEFDAALKTDEGKIHDDSFYTGFVTASHDFALVIFVETDSKFIENIRYAYADGTFKVVPKPFFSAYYV